MTYTFENHNNGDFIVHRKGRKHALILGGADATRFRKVLKRIPETHMQKALSQLWLWAERRISK